MKFPRHIPAVIQWALLVAVAAYLTTWVDPGVIDTPYTGF